MKMPSGRMWGLQAGQVPFSARCIAHRPHGAGCAFSASLGRVRYLANGANGENGAKEKQVRGTINPSEPTNNWRFLQEKKGVYGVYGVFGVSGVYSNALGCNTSADRPSVPTRGC